jgi:hypothetical protein
MDEAKSNAVMAMLQRNLDDLRRRAEKAEARIAEFERRGCGCAWSQNADGYYDTTCEKSFVLEGGTPSANGMRFCCYCGKALVYVPYVEREEG